MLLLKDFPADGTVIPFSSPQARYFLYLIVPELAMAIIVDVIVIIALIKQQQIPIDTLFILSLSIADFFFSVMIFVLGVGELIFDGFWAGKAGTIYIYYSFHSFYLLGCLWTEALIIFTLGASIISVFAMTLHRYLIVVRSYHLTQKQAIAILSGIWIGLAVVIGLFLAFEDHGISASLQSSELYCFIASTRPEVLNVIATISILFFILGTMIFIVYAYYFIVKRYVELKRTAQMKDQVSVMHPADNIQQIEAQHHRKEFSPVLLILQRPQGIPIGDSEIKLLKKAIAIAGSFVCIWTFFVGKLLFEVLSQQPVSTFYDSFIEVLFTAYPIFNGVILYLYDAKCRNNIQDLLYYPKVLFFYKSAKAFIQRMGQKKRTEGAKRSGAANHENQSPQKLLLRDIKLLTENVTDTVKM